MSESRERSGTGRKASSYSAKPGESSSYLFGGFWLLLFFGTLMVRGPWVGYHAVLLGGAALLMFLFPPVVSLPRVWWVLGGLFMLAGMGSFLPVAWFPAPEWRGKLEGLGLDAGSQVVIQPRQAMEALFLFGVTLVTGLWLAGHRASAKQIRLWVLIFASGVAVYAIFSKLKQSDSGGIFGFFPNRNHTATYLAMGTVCGLGCILQALRDKEFVRMTISLVVTAICLWAVAEWSISRGGVVLVIVGSLTWVVILGRNYLGKHGLRALGLIALAAVGFFFIADSAVKQRLSQTVERVKDVSSVSDETDDEVDQNAADYVDFRVPTGLDTLDLIRDFKWTGVGTGQFDEIFPQYRRLTSVINNTKTLHPESDWLWMTAETGIPATLILGALVIIAFRRALAGVLAGRDRALRGACLIAALLVPLHGLFDVPGHRMPLAWSSAFLFVLSLHSPNEERFVQSSVRKWLLRLTAVLIAGYAIFLARAQWWNGPPPAYTLAESVAKKSRQLHAEDAELQKAAAANGKIYQPSPEDDRLDRVTELLKEARKTAPMDPEILHLQGITALFFSDQMDLADRSFALERALDPTWVKSPLLQAQAWSGIDPQRTGALWKEAVERAKRQDQLKSDKQWTTARTLDKIKKAAKGKPELVRVIPKG